MKKARRVDFSLPTYFGWLKSTLLLSANIGTKNVNLRTFKLPKPDISDIFSQQNSDLIKSLRFTKLGTYAD